MDEQQKTDEMTQETVAPSSLQPQGAADGQEAEHQNLARAAEKGEKQAGEEALVPPVPTVPKFLMPLYDEAPILEVQGLKRFYAAPRRKLFEQKKWVRAVDGVDFNIYGRETLGLVGESGSGKSTIGRQLVGLEHPDEGRIFYKEQALEKLSSRGWRPYRRDIQMIFQDSYAALNPRKPIYEILAAPLLYHGLETPRTVERRIDELLDLVGLVRDSKNRYPHEFSGGQRQRLGIAKALSLKPKLIICDEPVSALDVSIQAQILNLLLDLQQQFELSYLFIGHGLASVRYMSDRLAVMYQGRIVEMGPAKRVFDHPLHPYTKALVQASPVADPEQRKFEAVDKSVWQDDEGRIQHCRKSTPSACPYYCRCPHAVERCRQMAVELEPLNPEAEPSEQIQLACPVMAERWHQEGGER